MNTKFAQFWENQFVPLGLLLGSGFVLVGIIVAWTALSIKAADNTLSVTGSAQTSVTSDSAKLTLMIVRTVPESGVPGGYAQVASDEKAVAAFLANHDVAASEMTVSPALANKQYDYNNTGAPTRYDITQSIVINSTRVDGITALANQVSSLAAQGVSVSASPPEYYYSKLSDLRVSLLGDALKDAKARADAIAAQSGQGVGRLQSASGGVVQVLAPNSINDVSDYGQYDTSSVQKDITITIHAVYAVR